MPDDALSVLAGGEVERAPAALVMGVHKGAMVQQHLNHLGVAGRVGQRWEMEMGRDGRDMDGDREMHERW